MVSGGEGKEGKYLEMENIWLAEEIKQRSPICLLSSDIGYCGGFICSSCGEETIQDKPPITSAVRFIPFKEVDNLRGKQETRSEYNPK